METNKPHIETTKKQTNHKFYSIVALITAIIPIIVWISILSAKAEGNFKSINSAGLIAILFYWSCIGYALPVVTIIFAILGLIKSSLKKTAIISLCLVAVHVILFISVLGF